MIPPELDRAGLGEPAVVVEAADEESEPRGSDRAPEVVASLARDELRIVKSHAHRVVRDEQRRADRLPVADQAAVTGRVDAPVAEGVDLRGLPVVEDVVDRAVPEKLLQ